MSDENPYGQPNYGQPEPGMPQHGDSPYGQPAYGQPAYGQPGGYGAPAQQHPSSTTVLVLGILSLICCQVLAPFAWIMGNKAVKEIDAAPGQYSGRESANIGRILGIIGTVLLVLSVIALIFYVAVLGFAFNEALDSGLDDGTWDVETTTP